MDEVARRADLQFCSWLFPSIPPSIRSNLATPTGAKESVENPEVTFHLITEE
jgi:hypothetical protein